MEGVVLRVLNIQEADIELPLPNFVICRLQSSEELPRLEVPCECRRDPGYPPDELSRLGAIHPPRVEPLQLSGETVPEDQAVLSTAEILSFCAVEVGPARLHGILRYRVLHCPAFGAQGHRLPPKRAARALTNSLS
jgi:hypothetical protein